MEWLFWTDTYPWMGWQHPVVFTRSVSGGWKGRTPKTKLLLVAEKTCRWNLYFHIFPHSISLRPTCFIHTFQLGPISSSGTWYWRWWWPQLHYRAMWRQRSGVHKPLSTSAAWGQAQRGRNTSAFWMRPLFGSDNLHKVGSIVAKSLFDGGQHKESWGVMPWQFSWLTGQIQHSSCSKFWRNGFWMVLQLRRRGWLLLGWIRGPL